MTDLCWFGVFLVMYLRKIIPPDRHKRGAVTDCRFLQVYSFAEACDYVAECQVWQMGEEANAAQPQPQILLGHILRRQVWSWSVIIHVSQTQQTKGLNLTISFKYLFCLATEV